MNLIQELEKEQFDKLSATKKIPEFGPGDTLIVNVKVVEGDRSRVQAYEGVCIGRSGGGLNESFTVRKISYGEGVERVFPVMSPMIELDHGGAPRQGSPRQAVLPAQPARQVGPHRREEDGSRRSRRRVIAAISDMTESAGLTSRAFLLRSIVAMRRTHVASQGAIKPDVSGSPTHRVPRRSRRPQPFALALLRPADDLGACGLTQAHGAIRRAIASFPI